MKNYWPELIAALATLWVVVSGRLRPVLPWQESGRAALSAVVTGVVSA